MADDKIIDKIEKCLALASSGNEHEAAAALRQAQKLMEAYGISDQDVLASQASERAAKAGAVSKPAAWENALASRIARAFGCEVIFGRRTWTIGEWTFIGAGASPEVAGYAFEVLFRQARRARSEYIDKALHRVRRPAIKTARADLFCNGWVQTAMSAVTAWTSTDQQQSAVAAYIASNYPDLRDLAPINRQPTNLRDHHLNDFAHGRAAGREAVLNRGVGAGPDPLALEG